MSLSSWYLQTDVSGDCSVHYEVIKEGWGSSKIRKTKDLMGCTERHGHVTAFQSSPYRVDSVSLNTFQSCVTRSKLCKEA